MKKNSIYLTRGALIAALYVILTYISALLGLSGGIIQFRLSEMLSVLPLFFPEAILGLTAGCLIANILTGCFLWDIIFGAVATLIGALGARLFIKAPKHFKWLATLPTVISNSLIIPLILIYTYGAEGGYLYFLITVGIGETVCAGILGSLLYYTLEKANFKNLLN